MDRQLRKHIIIVDLKIKSMIIVFLIEICLGYTTMERAKSKLGRLLDADFLEGDNTRKYWKGKEN